MSVPRKTLTAEYSQKWDLCLLIVCCSFMQCNAVTMSVPRRTLTDATFSIWVGSTNQFSSGNTQFSSGNSEYWKSLEKKAIYTCCTWCTCDVTCSCVWRDSCRECICKFLASWFWRHFNEYLYGNEDTHKNVYMCINVWIYLCTYIAEFGDI